MSNAMTLVSRKISHVQRIKQQRVPKSKEKIINAKLKYHTRNDCYFENTLCFECGWEDHTASVCRKKNPTIR